MIQNQSFSCQHHLQRPFLDLSKATAFESHQVSMDAITYRERPQPNYDQWTIDNADALRRSLERLAFLREHVDVADDLGGSYLRNNRHSEG